MKRIDTIDYYEILNINHGANAAEIHSAYIKAKEALRSESMPHYSSMSEEEKKKMRLKIEEAYSHLTDQQNMEEVDSNLTEDYTNRNESADNSNNMEPATVTSKKKSSVVKIAIFIEKFIFIFILLLIAFGLLWVVGFLFPL